MSEKIPDPALNRLTRYLRVLGQLAHTGLHRISSEQLADAAGVNSPTLRRDLGFVGAKGRRGVGYDVSELISRINLSLGLTEQWRVVIVGAGHLGTALGRYPGFAAKSFTIEAIVDADPAVVGSDVGARRVEPVEDLARLVAEREINMAVLAIPAKAAQEAVDALVSAGVVNILSFAPGPLRAPQPVTIRHLDMAQELQILAYHARNSPRQEGEGNERSAGTWQT